jgi:protocatechuate 3,4-dioxygenase beta subunit
MVSRPVLGAAAILACALVVSGAAQQAPGQPQQPARDTSARPATTTATATGKMSGRVLAGDTGRPIKRARVFINAQDLPGGRGALTDDNGVFDFTDLPAGRYTVNASKSGYIQLSFGQRRPLQAGTPIQLLAGQQLKGIDFALPRGGVVSGRVSDESGDVMPGVQVQVMRYQYQQGDRRLVPAGQAQTDDRGVYRVWGLNPGDYYVSATARNEGLGRGFGPAQVQQIVQDAIQGAGGRGALQFGGGRGGGRGANIAALAGAAPTDDQEQLMYAPTYYPGVGSPADARAVTVGVSQEVDAIDFALQLVRTARISGHVENPDGSWTMQGNVQLVPQTTGTRGNFGQNYGGRIGWDGQFSIANVPPGQYTLRARNQDRDAPLSTSQPLSIASGGDLPNVVVVLQNGGSLSGSLVFLPGSTPVPGDLSQIRITAPAAEPDDNVGPQTNPRVNKDGTFTMDGVTVGSHFVRANGQLRGWNLKSVEINGRDVTDTPIEIRSGQKINNVVLTFTDKVSEIDGSVTDASGQPVTEYTVLAFSTNTAHWRAQSRQIATSRPDQTGMFKIRNLPSGEYYVVTIDPAEPGEWFDPQYLDQHRAGAARVTLGDGDIKTQDFRVSR